VRSSLLLFSAGDPKPFRLIVAMSAALLAACVSTDPIHGAGGAGVTTGEGGSTSTDPVTDGPTGTGGGTAATGMGGGDPCGDTVCEGFEDCSTCPTDCGACGPMCGDRTCDDATEDCASCPQDCGACSVCGDDVCSADEDCKTCYEDCGICVCKPDGLEANNSSLNASVAASGTDYCDLSVCSGDVDWFKFTVAHGFTAKILFAEGQGDLDLEIYQSQYLDGSYSADDDESVTLSGLAAGTYYARVYGKASAAIPTNPDYCFRVDTN
jgi:hypothetical protein